MLLVSQNLLKYGMDFPPDTVLRINLAEIFSTSEIVKKLSES